MGIVFTCSASQELTLTGRFHAADPFGADGGGVHGVPRQHQPVPGAQIGITGPGVEHDPAADAIQHLFITMLMPAVGVVWGIAPGVRSGRRRTSS
jgi:hypothetical protein